MAHAELTSDRAEAAALPDELDLVMARGATLFSVAVAWTAMLGSLYFSEVRGFVPCPLCWYQRILMYPLAVILVVGLARRDRHLPVYVWPFVLIGIGVSTYHYLLQKTNWFTQAVACQAGVPCSLQYINWLGFITIPFLALAAFLLIALSTSFARRVPEAWSGSGDSPWRALMVVVVAVVLFYGVLRATVG